MVYIHNECKDKIPCLQLASRKDSGCKNFGETVGLHIGEKIFTFGESEACQVMKYFSYSYDLCDFYFLFIVNMQIQTCVHDRKLMCMKTDIIL